MKRFCYGWMFSIQFCGGVQAKQNKISYVGLLSTKLGIILNARPRSSNGHIPSIQRTIKTPTPDCKGIRSEMHQFLATERRLSTDLWASPLSSWSYGIESACLTPSQLMVVEGKVRHRPSIGDCASAQLLCQPTSWDPLRMQVVPRWKISLNIHQKCIQMISRWYDQKLFLLWKLPGFWEVSVGAHDRLKHLSWELFTANHVARPAVSEGFRTSNILKQLQ